MLKIRARHRRYKGNTYTLNHWCIWLYKMGLIETQQFLDVRWWIGQGRLTYDDWVN